MNIHVYVADTILGVDKNTIIFSELLVKDVTRYTLNGLNLSENYSRKPSKETTKSSRVVQLKVGDL